MAIPLPHTRWGFDNNVIPGWSESATQARVSLEALRKFVELSPDVRVIYGLSLIHISEPTRPY